MPGERLMIGTDVFCWFLSVKVFSFLHRLPLSNLCCKPLPLVSHLLSYFTYSSLVTLANNFRKCVCLYLSLFLGQSLCHNYRVCQFHVQVAMISWLRWHHYCLKNYLRIIRNLISSTGCKLVG